MKVLHLMINKVCDHACKLCCNKFYNIDEIPIVTVKELQSVDTVCITGGEPFISKSLETICSNIKHQYSNIKHLYIYTSGSALYASIMDHKFYMYFTIDGLTIAPKCKMDWKSLEELIEFGNPIVLERIKSAHSNIIYVFEDQKDQDRYSHIAEKLNAKIVTRTWNSDVKEKPDEIFRRLPIFI